VRVATPDDPASSRLGESFYAFWPRTVIGSLRNAWRLEARRIGRHDKHPFRIGNDVLNSWLMTAVLWAVMIIVLGPGIAPYLLVQALIAITLLEAVNYLEHYGMLRQIVGKPGFERYERVDPTHSWNSNHIATNVLLYHLQRHSDHHAHPTRRYQALRDHAQAPALPTGYAGMILLALVPPLWRRVMDPRVLAHYDGDAARANLTRRARAKLVAGGVGTPVGAPPAHDSSSSGGPGQARPAVTAYRCPGCSYTYDVERGDRREGFAPGTAWSSVPDSWCCPDCGVREKVDFVPVDPVATQRQ
jgi:alkane 1-monooxygenase